ncbi:MAG: 30S ribosomal protein S6 [Anaerolineae bacterium]|nr:30S ribosomal protein S6 [Anaerolineae bacterium]MDW8173173.1 30S ribosomal protein S6 [Anaerolineae bacterium]
MKRPYEITILFRILATEEETQAAIDQVKAWIEKPTDDGVPQGIVNKIDRNLLGRRKLAYEIDKQRDGLYVIFYADVETNHLTDLELNLKVYTPVLRYLLIRLDEEASKASQPSASEA